MGGIGVPGDVNVLPVYIPGENSENPAAYFVSSPSQFTSTPYPGHRLPPARFSGCSLEDRRLYGQARTGNQWKVCASLDNAGRLRLVADIPTSTAARAGDSAGVIWGIPVEKAVNPCT